MDKLVIFGVAGLTLLMIGGVVAIMIGAHREQHRDRDVKKDEDWYEFV